MNVELAKLQESFGARYLLARELGSGGMATVYLAEDSERGELVAIKVLRRELTAVLGATRFHREIGILSRLQHPNIVRVLDSSEAGARLYYVMPFITGDSLRRELVTDGPLPLDRAISIVGDIAAAIDCAHAQGVLHRDIKPENILLEAHRALIRDFGVARAIEAAGDESFSSSGLVVGTPAYMSPEQATGAEVDRRSDIYALGCVLYEMLAGEPPFTGVSRQAIVARHLTERPRSIGIVRGDVSDVMKRAVLAALSKQPHRRPASGAELIGRLVPSSAD
jgi:serine/threonine-protein kinase